MKREADRDLRLQRIVSPRLFGPLSRNGGHRQAHECFRGSGHDHGYGYSRLPVFESRIDNVVGILYRSLTARNLTFQWANSCVLLILYRRRRIDELLVVLKRKPHQPQSLSTNLAVLWTHYWKILSKRLWAKFTMSSVTTGLWRAVNMAYVDARASVEQLNQDLSMNIPNASNYETIAGFVLTQLRHIPRIGEAVVIDENHRLVVTQASPRAIQQVKIYVTSSLKE